MRERLTGEITLVSAKHSKTLHDNELEHAANHTIDLDWRTRSSTVAGRDGKIWLKVKLAKAACIHQVEWYKNSSHLHLTWTCSSTDCSTCEGTPLHCPKYSLTVSIKSTSSDDLPSQPDCKYGDTVIMKLKRTDTNSGFIVCEIAVIRKQGEILIRRGDIHCTVVEIKLFLVI